MQFICLIRDKSTSNCAFYDTFCTSERTKVSHIYIKVSHKVRVKIAKVGNKMQPKVVVLLPLFYFKCLK
jgi:hypothetical protein